MSIRVGINGFGRGQRILAAGENPFPAQEAVDQRWAVYEEMATHGAGRFPADARRS
jgi:hypothetical protein